MLLQLDRGSELHATQADCRRLSSQMFSPPNIDVLPARMPPRRCAVSSAADRAAAGLQPAFRRQPLSQRTPLRRLRRAAAAGRCRFFTIYVCCKATLYFQAPLYQILQATSLFSDLADFQLHIRCICIAVISIYSQPPPAFLSRQAEATFAAAGAAFEIQPESHLLSASMSRH